MLNRIELRTEPCGMLLKTFLQTDMDQAFLGTKPAAAATSSPRMHRSDRTRRCFNRT